MDGILSYHMNPLTCGVAKFNTMLSRRLRVPLLHLFDPAARDFSRPLLSFKISEFRRQDVPRLERLLRTARWRDAFRLFLHEWGGSEVERRLVGSAAFVFCGNSELMAQLGHLRSGLAEVWCPGTLVDAQPFERCEISVFSFGMAHKLRVDHYRRLQQLLEETGRSYCLYLSSALHENTSLDGSFMGAYEELREILRTKVYFLGFLSDAAVYNYLAETTFFAAFFEKGVRANNTSVNAAMQCGSVVITNLSEHSPRAFVHLDNVLDIHQCTHLPRDEGVLAGIRARARKTAEELGWSGLLEKMSRWEAGTGQEG